ncbi:MAG: sigma-70 family RNA polymerase sigma factor [Treponema sp.]|nr:sigma-70 family RNA polymerase sigma factor [Treponema sp.]
MRKEKSNNDVAFDKLCRDNQKNLQKFVFRLAGEDKHIADDIIQETYLYAVENKEKLLTHPKPTAWLYKSAHIFYKRNMSILRTVQTNEESLDNIAKKNAESNFNLFVEIDYGGDTEEIFSALSDKEKDLVELRYGQGFSLEEIAVMRQVSYITVRRRHAKILRKLKCHFEESNKS